MSGSPNKIEELVLHKLESMGEKFLDELISEVLPNSDILGRVQEAVETGGKSEIARARKEFLHKMALPRPSGTGLITGTTNRIEQAFYKNRHLLNRPEGRYQTWSKSRQEWLDQGWKHDWRSQPRDYHGRWTPGRLRSPYVSKGARRIRRQRRLAARKAVREQFEKMKGLS